MVPRLGAAVRTIPLLGVMALLVAACQKVPLLAPSGSTITLTAAVNALPVNGTAQIVAQVIEASGQPPHSGTQVTFTTTLGTVQPANVETDSNGQAVATFNAGAANGTATITAISGGSSASGNNAIKIAVGTAAVGAVRLSANPTIVPANGGTTTLTAQVFDINGNALPSAPVSFTTTAGNLDQTLVSTASNGSAIVHLTTANQATVTASVGATGSTSGTPTTGTPGTGTGGTTGTTSTQTSATVTINVAGAPQLVITPPTTAPSAGLPASFTFAVTAATTNGATIRDVTVDWGDGSANQDLGAVTGNAVVSHIYHAAGTYIIKAVVTDANGFSVPVSTTVTVNATTVPITLTAPTTPPGAGIPATFTLAPGTLPAGDFIRDVQVNWGDGSAVQDIGAISGSISISHVFASAGSFLVSATVSDTAGNANTVSAPVTVIATALPTIVLTPSVPSSCSTSATPCNVTFTIQVTVPTGVTVQSASIDYGDGTTQSLGGLNGTATVQHPYAAHAGNKTVTVTVVDSVHANPTTAQTVVNIP